MSGFKNKFDSVRQDWNTPISLFKKLDDEFHFALDLAASKENSLCSSFYTKEDNGLSKEWDGVCWLNPPFGDKSSKMVDWIKKAYESSQVNPNLTVVMLIPARTNTKWFHKYCMNASEIRFICGRPKFGDSKHGLPQPLVLVVFKKSEYTKFSSFNL